MRLLTTCAAAIVGVSILAIALSAAQAKQGEIFGRITDSEGGVIPGARIVIEAGGERRTAVTDSAGRFSIGQLPLMAHQVRVELSGFIPASGTVELSSTVTRAHLAWTMRLGCLQHHQIVLFRPREAARLADAILHVRVTSDNGALLRSNRPDCPGEILQSYAIDVLHSLELPKRTATSGAPGEILLRPREAPLEAGREYIALLGPDGRAFERLVLPIVDGRVTGAAADELVGMTVSEALRRLAQFARGSFQLNTRATRSLVIDSGSGEIARIRTHRRPSGHELVSSPPPSLPFISFTALHDY